MYSTKKKDIEDYSKHIFFYENYIPPLLEKTIKHLKFKSIADIGCGDGVLLRSLKEKGYLNKKTVYASDLSCNRVNLVKNIDSKFKCLVQNACNLKKLKANNLDIGISEQVIEHVEDDFKMASELSRILKRGGYLYISTVFKKSYAWYYFRNNGKWVLDPTHVREYTRDKDLIQKLEKAGFKVIEQKKKMFGFPAIDFFLRRFNASREIYSNKFFKFLRRIKIPIIGYYKWELLCIKK
jgi:2-polyprenyl-3-methyl-5-hydroxy-6-metoxy-1,4-benzoquinol methylase